MDEQQVDVTSHTNTDGAEETNTTPLLGEQAAQESKDQSSFALPEEYTGNQRFEGVDSLEALAKRLAEMPDAPSIPEAPDKYELPDIEGFQPEQMNGFKEFAHKNNLTEAQAKEIINFNNNLHLDLQAKENQAIEAGVVALRDEWGKDFETNISLANEAIGKFDTEDRVISGFLKNNPAIGNNPDVIRFFQRIGNVISDDVLVPGSGSTGNERENDGLGGYVLSSYDKSMG